MNWWTAEPVLYTMDDFEGHRIRLIVAEKRARIATRIGEKPAMMAEINPEGIYPILVDKNLVCFGSALEELLHERYPSPSLLPVDPTKRAQVRMLASSVTAWYGLELEELVRRLHTEVASYYAATSTAFMCGRVISTVDLALLPIIHRLTEDGDYWPIHTAFADYIRRLTCRQSFLQSLSNSNPIEPEADLDSDDEVAA